MGEIPRWVTAQDAVIAITHAMIVLEAVREDLERQIPHEVDPQARINKLGQLGQLTLGSMFEPKPLDHRGPED